MKHFPTAIVMLWALTGLHAQAAPPPVVRLPGTVVNVVDGDTEDVEVRFIVRVRLLADEAGTGCWAPESHLQSSIKNEAERKAEKQRGDDATKSLEDRSLGKECLMAVPLTSNRLLDLITLGRFLGTVTVGDESMGEYQVRTKHASTHKGGKLGE